MAGGLAFGLAGVWIWAQWRLLQAAARRAAQARRRQPFQCRLPQARLRVLLVGDSTGVGLGIGYGRSTLPGLLASRLRHASITNRCRSGARIEDVLQQLPAIAPASRPYDLVMIFAGGNDVLRATPLRAVADGARQVGRRARQLARRVVWLGHADVGSAPVFLPPLAWWLSRRSRRVSRVLATEARRAGVDFVDFAAAPHGPRFARDTARYFAPDGLHPSASANRYCMDVLMRRPALASLGSALP
jgi:lysophospholipase L1-like esterase